jgi:hypothetical protein
VVQARCSERVENLGFGDGGDARPFQGDRQAGTIKVSGCRNLVATNRFRTSACLSGEKYPELTDLSIFSKFSLAAAAVNFSILLTSFWQSLREPLQNEN